MNMGNMLNNGVDGLNDTGGQYLTFILAEEEYGVEILRVQEIRGWTNVTAIPKSPSYLRGVINLRGDIVPIIDLRERFGIEAVEYDATTVVIVIRVKNDEDEEKIMGIVVDAVSEVYTVNPEDFQPPPELGNVVEEHFVSGLASVDEKMVILLDIDVLMNTQLMAEVA